MTENPRHPKGHRPPETLPEPRSEGEAIRRAADGELEGHPEVGGDPRVAGERLLRQAVGRAMGEVPIPKGLADRVAGAVRHADRQEALSVQTRNPSFWTRGRFIGALAASLLVLVGLSGLLLTQRDPAAGMPAAALRFVAREHQNCAVNEEYASRKLALTQAEAVPAAYAALVGHPVALFDLKEAARQGLRFVSAGQCGVPDPGRIPSMHMRFTHDAQPGSAISLFVLDTPAWPAVAEGKSFLIQPAEGTPQDGSTTLVWRRQGVLYFLVADGPAGAAAAREALSAPAEPRTVRL